MTIAAGLFLVRKDNKILVGHPTNHNADFWSIPKGKIEEGENPIDAAVRETLEETNADVSKWTVTHTLPPIKYKRMNKTLHPFILFEKQNKINFDDFKLECNSNVISDKGNFPEMDAFRWVTVEEARTILHSSQVECLDKVDEIISMLEKHGL